ncbi:MAG: 2'-deoxycytidine 5'-triphosphate deaminase [Chloroflexi bacterium]|nr:2'-deoxycytidine 5'-triphosphate deaminase [Chloroflexota bacterium]
MDKAGASPGIFPSQLLEEAARAEWICSDEPIRPDQVQPASLDLRLGPVAYRVRASFLPGKHPVVERLDSLKTHQLDLSVPTVLERGCIYIVPLVERLQLPESISARANPKSSTGRLDVFTRLITDFSREFDQVRPGYKGGLYLEIVPQTFSILVRAGTRLTQLRLMRGSPADSDALLNALHEEQTLVFGDEEATPEPFISRGLWLSVDMRGGDLSEIIGYRAKPHTPLVDVDQVGAYDPRDFWDPIERPRDGQLLLNPEAFYILCSKERIRVPMTAAAEMVSYEPSVGEFRNHYAGFFDPGFGFRTDDVRGTHAVLEVRSHEVPFILEDGQHVSRLVYQTLIEPANKAYGADLGSSYQHQRVSLSKHFKPWEQ